MRYVRYRNGLKLHGMKCPFCLSKKRATVFQNRIRWMHRFSCGHINVAGYMMPPDVLQDEGLANNNKNVEDPRYEWKTRHDRWRKVVKSQSYDDFQKRQDMTSLDGGSYVPIATGAQLSRKSE